MGYFNLVPHIYFDRSHQTLTGAAIDYFTRVAAAMGYDVEWTGPLPFPRLMRYLKEGKVDGSLMMNKNPEREAFLFYPEAPFHWVRRILVVRHTNPLVHISSIDDIRGYRIGFMEDAHLSPFIKNNRDKITLELIGGHDWVKQNLLKLDIGRLDAVYDLNAETMRYTAKLLKMQDRIRILPLPEPPGGVHVVFSKTAPEGLRLLALYEREAESWDYGDFLKPYLE